MQLDTGCALLSAILVVLIASERKFPVVTLSAMNSVQDCQTTDILLNKTTKNRQPKKRKSCCIMNGQVGLKK